MQDQVAGAGDQAGVAILVEDLVDEELDDRAGRVIADGNGSGMSIAGIAVASFVSPYDVPSWGGQSAASGEVLCSAPSCRILARD